MALRQGRGSWPQCLLSRCRMCFTCKIDAARLNCFSMNEVEKKYRNAISQMGGPARFERCLSLLDEMVGMLRRRLNQDKPGLPEIQIRREIAVKLYRRDKNIQRMLQTLS